MMPPVVLEPEVLAEVLAAYRKERDGLVYALRAIRGLAADRDLNNADKVSAIAARLRLSDVSGSLDGDSVPQAREGSPPTSATK